MKILFLCPIVCCLFVVTTPIVAVAADNPRIEHVNQADPPSSTTLLPPDSGSIAFKFPDTTNSWQVNFAVERDLPEISFSISGEAISKESFVILDKANADQALLTICADAGLPSDCTTDPTPISDFELEPGDILVANVHFQVVDNTDAKPRLVPYDKTYRYQHKSIGTLRIGVGTFFVFSGADDYFTSTYDGTNVVSSKSGDDLTLNLAATATWIPHKYISGNGLTGGWNFGPTVGVGTNSDNVSVFAGASAIYRRAWTVTAGLAIAKESTLISQYKVGQEVPEPIDSTALTKESYKFRPFVGLTWAPPKKE